MSSASTQPAPDASVSVGMAPHTRRHHPYLGSQRSSPLPATAARSPAPVGGNALHVDHIGALRFRHYESLPRRAAAAANVLDSNALLLGETAEPGSRLPPPGTQRPPMALSARHWLSAHSVMSIDALMGSTDSNYDDTNAGCASAAQGSGQPSSPTPSSSLFTLVEMAALCSELPTAHAHSPDSDDTVSSHSSNSVRSSPSIHHAQLARSHSKRRLGSAAASQSQTNEVRRFLCTICSKLFTRRYNLDAHIRSHMNVKPYACTHFVGGTNGKSPCTESFIRKHDLVRHIASVHERKMFGPCPWCGRSYSRSDSYNKHVRGEELLRGMAS
ncbi:hypothetical protein BC831DRAFT_551028 [Entophlyctis helioformis]|nr:hypothetical protein BC831DRAFT_551028 [Entophlyctis helioformis]